MTTITPCAYGCTSRGLHLADGQAHDGCRGCAPRLATNGHLCGWCWQRLHADIVDAPHLIRHLRHHGEPTAGHPAGGDGRTHTDPAYKIPNPPEWGAADEVGNTIVGWVRVIVEEHPAGLTGPDEAAIWWTRSRLVTDDPDGPYVVERKPAGIRHPNALDPIVKWLLPHLDWCAEQPWIDEMRRDLAREIGTAKARWPMIERSHAVTIPCPRCDARTLVYHPPTFAGASMSATCTNEECGRMYGEDEWDRLRELVRIAAGRP